MEISDMSFEQLLASYLLGRISEEVFVAAKKKLAESDNEFAQDVTDVLDEASEAFEDLGDLVSDFNPFNW